MLRFAYLPVTLRRPSPTLGGGFVRQIPSLLVGVTGPTGMLARRFRLDSGADDTISPLSYAAKIGLDPTNAPTTEAESASGSIVRYCCASVTLRISDGVEWCQWDAVIDFVAVPRQTGLVGVAGSLEHFDVELLGNREFTLNPTANFPGQHGRHRSQLRMTNHVTLLQPNERCEAKTEVRAPGLRTGAAPVRRPAVLRGEVPGTTTKHPGRASGAPVRVCHRSRGVFPIPILAPLPDMTRLVPQPPRIAQAAFGWEAWSRSARVTYQMPAM